MSTIADLISTLQYRLDTMADLVHLFNQAIRMVAKRLYTMESSIIVSGFDTDLYAAVTYASAGNIAFVDGGGSADTITDSSNGFSTAGFHATMYINTDQASNHGPFKITTVAAGTLTMPTATLVAAGGASGITITSIPNYFDLPTGFWGLKGSPWLSGKYNVLEPLPDRETALSLQVAGVPEYYEIKGSRMYTYPSPASDVVLNGDYFVRPTAITATTDTVPFNEIFDDAICEVTMLLYDANQTNQVTNYKLAEEIIKSYVELIAPKWDRKSATDFQDAVQWDALI